MPTHFTGRVTLIIVVLLGALWMIFPRGDVRHPDLKPGIDMVGGTSLLYEIKTPPGGYAGFGGHTLAEDVMESLKKRVDPTGVRNLIWRPQGNTRLEIQMPLTSTSKDSRVRREVFGEAQKALEATNVRPNDVTTTIEQSSGQQRADRLKQLAMGSASRQKLFDELARTWDQIQSARQARDAASQAAAQNRYDELKDQIGPTNLSSQTLQDVLDLKEPDRGQRLEKLKAQSADFPARLAAIDDFVAKYASYSEVKASIDDAGELKRLLRGSGVLEFHILANDLPPEDYRTMVERLQKDGPQVRATDNVKWYVVDRPDEFRAQTVEYNGKHYVLAYTTPDKSLVHNPSGPAWGLQRAGADNSEGNRKVAFAFDPTGAKMFGDLTGNNVGKPLGIVLDDKLISAPNINQQIHGQGVITGGGAAGFDEKEQRYLISTLGAGSLPAQLTDEPISERTVGPQLGADNLRAGLMACCFGLVVVAAFLVGYYYLAGVVAFIAVLMNLALILGIMAMLNATFTLPGVAGIVLAIGAAVDANVLIFERLREEQHRGLSLRLALRNSYDRAWSAILDSNMTTVITSAILYWLGTEEVKGFGITLLIGLVSSMFTALFVTKTIFGILIEKFGITDLTSLPRTFPKWDQMLQPKVDWIRKVPYFAALSAVLILTGCAAFWYYGHKGELLDIEFASGTSVQFELKEPMHIDELRRLVPEQAGLPSPAVVSVGNDDKTYEIVTPSSNAPEVRAVILKSLGDRLRIDLPSSYAEVGTAAVDVIDRLIFPLTDREHLDPLKAATGGWVPGDWLSYKGGAAIVLKDINPPLRPSQIRARIDRERLQPQPGQPEQRFREIKVDSSLGNDDPTTLAAVLVYDQALPYEIDPGKWRDELVVPMWKTIGDGVNKPANLQKVSNFDAQVAGDTQRDALMALILSLIVIMIYIWLRFGNLKYGTATMIAMVHDTLLVLAAIGLSHLLARYAPAIAGALLLEPFRLNITIVAAILTVMSYSMIDTIVVFDRVRENRGKFGSLNRKIINDSINQTMSRTLLTAGTNIVTLFFMYIFGGPGIHGFTFVLLFGILVGTYSSIAIAAPILLLGRKEATQPQAASGKKSAVAAQLQRVGG